MSAYLLALVTSSILLPISFSRLKTETHNSLVQFKLPEKELESAFFDNNIMNNTPRNLINMFLFVQKIFSYEIFDLSAFNPMFLFSEEVNHTFGPLDGSIYATVAKKSDLSPGAVSSPLTVSMDSGISSAGKIQFRYFDCHLACSAESQ